MLGRGGGGEWGRPTTEVPIVTTSSDNYKLSSPWNVFHKFNVTEIISIVLCLVNFTGHAIILHKIESVFYLSKQEV